MSAPDRPWSDADRELLANAYHWAARNSCGPDNCPGAAECVYAEHLDWDAFGAGLDALTAAGWRPTAPTADEIAVATEAASRAVAPLIAARVRAQVAEETAQDIADQLGPDPSPASSLWWAGYAEAKRDSAAIARTHRTTPTEETTDG